MSDLKIEGFKSRRIALRLGEVGHPPTHAKQQQDKGWGAGWDGTKPEP